MDRSRLALWGGVEASVVRVGDRYVDQVRLTGHHDRLNDLDLAASLGIEAIRYPVIWERVAPEGIKRADWSWTDERLERLRQLGITPIVTLLHHGSGPRYTNLLDPDFPRKLAAYARAVARRYPWLRFFTPVNEPLTTARFSTLYGHWYPHARDDRAFVSALLHQIEGIARAMAAIREEIPDAGLVHTEDLAKSYSTPELSYQAEFENARRWTGTDLLCGGFSHNDRMNDWFVELGLDVTEAALERYRCEPDVLGFNYYITSERFLDHRTDRYPRCAVGGNARNRYVDLEAVRVCIEGTDGVLGLLSEACERYRRPLAVTEVHLACTREEQIRWVDEIYDDLSRMRAEGADVRAFTLWALFGACDWNSLLTRHDDYYESGCFDARDNPPRETLLAAWARKKAGGSSLRHPTLQSDGWWRRPARLTEGAAPRGSAPPARLPRYSSRPIAIYGRSKLADRMAKICESRALNAVMIASDDSVRRLQSRLRSSDAWLVVDADSGETVMARAAGAAGIPIVAFSGAVGECFSRAESAALLATKVHVIARFRGIADLDGFLDRIIDMAIDGVSCFIPEAPRGGIGRAS